MLYTMEDFCGSKFMSVPSKDVRMDVCPHERIGCVKGCTVWQSGCPRVRDWCDRVRRFGRAVAVLSRLFGCGMFCVIAFIIPAQLVTDLLR